MSEFIGHIARPFAIIWTAICSGIATLILAGKIEDPVQAGVFIGVVYTAGLAPLYLGKAWELAKASKHDAEVKIAEAGK